MSIGEKVRVKSDVFCSHYYLSTSKYNGQIGIVVDHCDSDDIVKFKDGHTIRFDTREIERIEDE